MAAARYAVNNLTATVLDNLKDMHDWTRLEISDESTFQAQAPERPIIRGLPPRRLYIHPDDQIEALIQERATGTPVPRDPVPEWVLPIHLSEQWSISRFSAIFDALPKDPESKRSKRVVLATVHNDSTVVYYLMHEGMVKPRQN